jgi:hypothetical protein
VIACGDGSIDGTYSASLSRGTGCGNPAPKTSATDVEIVAADGVVHIHGALACDVNFTIDDYGGVGTVQSVSPGCGYQPAGMTLQPGSTFSPKEFELKWVTSSTPPCTITDTWTLTH